MKRGSKEWIIATKGLEYYEYVKARQREYEKQHTKERNEYKKRPVLAFKNKDDYYKIWFSSSADAAEILSGNRKKATAITSVIHNKLKSYKGLKWDYLK